MRAVVLEIIDDRSESSPLSLGPFRDEFLFRNPRRVFDTGERIGDRRVPRAIHRMTRERYYHFLEALRRPPVEGRFPPGCSKRKGVRAVPASSNPSIYHFTALPSREDLARALRQLETGE